jgi:hypothetical protein
MVLPGTGLAPSPAPGPPLRAAEGRDGPAPSGKVCATDGGRRVTATAWGHQREVREARQMIVSDPQLGTAVLSNPQIMSNLL